MNYERLKSRVTVLFDVIGGSFGPLFGTEGPGSSLASREGGALFCLKLEGPGPLVESREGGALFSLKLEGPGPLVEFR